MAQISDPVTEDINRILQAARQTRSVRAIFFGTRDRASAMADIQRAATTLGVDLNHFTVTATRRFDRQRMNWQTVSAQPCESVDCLRRARGLRQGGIVLLENLAALLRDDDGNPSLIQELGYLLTEHDAPGGLVLILLEAPEARCHLPTLLADRFVPLERSYPRRDELEALCRRELATFFHRAKGRLDVSTIHREAPAISDQLVGLTRSAARDALWDALSATPNDFSAARGHLADRKKEKLARDLQMKVLETTGAEMPVGLDNLLEYLRIQKPYMRQRGPGRARGVLLVGPPGTGKTQLAKAVGALLELPVVAFAIAALMNSLLGETERRFQQAFETLMALAPVLVFIDEIEKAFGESGGELDGGTMRRTSGAMLSFLSDCLDPVYVIGTSNSLTRMGEMGRTMTRSERFDSIFFVDVPNRAARETILNNRLVGKIADAPLHARDLAEASARFSGADLVSVVKQAEARGRADGTGLTAALLRRELDAKRRRAEALYAEFQPLREWGWKNCEPAGPTDPL